MNTINFASETGTVRVLNEEELSFINSLNLRQSVKYSLAQIWARANTPTSLSVPNSIFAVSWGDVILGAIVVLIYALDLIKEFPFLNWIAGILLIALYAFSLSLAFLAFVNYSKMILFKEDLYKLRTFVSLQGRRLRLKAAKNRNASIIHLLCFEVFIPLLLFLNQYWIVFCVYCFIYLLILSIKTIFRMLYREKLTRFILKVDAWDKIMLLNKK